MRLYNIAAKDCPNGFNCSLYYVNCHLQHNQQLCKNLKYIYSKDLALTERYNLFKEQRKSKSDDSFPPDLMAEIFICENLYLPAKKIMELYNYDGFITKELNQQKVNRLKRKIKNIIKTKDYSKENIEVILSEYIEFIKLTSFNETDLDIYVKALTYLFEKNKFKMTRNNSSRIVDEFEFNWIEFADFLGNQSHNPGNSIYFLPSFCKTYNINRNTCTRLFSYFHDLKYFSYADLDYIANSLLETLNLEEFNTDEIQKYLNVIYAFTTNQKKSES